MMETKAKTGDLVCVMTKKHNILEFGEVVEIGTVFSGANPQYEVADRYYDNGDPLFLRDGEFLLVNNPEDYDKLIERGVDGELRKIYVPKDIPPKAETGDLVRVITKNHSVLGFGEIVVIDAFIGVFGTQYAVTTSSGEIEFLFEDEFELLEEESPQQNDAVNHPSHYTQGRFEVIDIIEDAVQGADPFEAVCLANVIKYTTRYRHKNGVEDLKKAQWYLAKLITILEGGNE